MSFIELQKEIFSKLSRYKLMLLRAGISSDDVSKKVHFDYYHNHIVTVAADTQYPQKSRWI